MNLAIHGIDGDLSSRWDDTFYADKHPDLKADYMLAHPPFNMSDWSRKADDPRWRFGTPPAGNSNFAWIQHVISKLNPHGSAGIVMANGSMSSKQSGEGEIRAAIVEAGLGRLHDRAAASALACHRCPHVRMVPGKGQVITQAQEDWLIAAAKSSSSMHVP